MKIFFRHSIATLIFIGFAIAISAQRPEQFPVETPEFLSQLGVFMSSSKNEVLEKTFKEFDGIFRAGSFSSIEGERIIRTCNAMLTRRLSPNPHFQAYLNSLMAFKGTMPDEQKFAEWHVILDSMLLSGNHQTTQFTDFIGFSTNYFRNKSLNKAEPAGTTWKIYSDKTHLRYKNKQPFLMMEEGNLVASRKTDSIRLANTTGIYYPLKGQWIGKGGQVGWQRVGLDSTVITELGNYTLDVQKGLYETDQAYLVYPQYFGTQKIPGQFSDKVSIDGQGSYPRFNSANKDLEIRNFAEGVRFRGGFNLEGTTIYGTGSDSRRAIIEIYDKKNQRIFKGTARRFSVRRGEQIGGEGVESVFYYKKDSLFHPSVNFRYTIKDQVLQLYRGERGSDRNPFFSSNHQINFDADNFKAYLAKDSVVIGDKSVSFARKEPVKFESLQYFNKKDYDQMQSIATANPLARLKQLSDELGKDIYADEYAAKLNPTFKVENITSLIYDLVGQGFIRYNADSLLIHVQDKVQHYYNSYMQRSDYDQLRIVSKTDSANATLNLRDNSILIKGVKWLEFSRLQQVGVIPDDDFVVMRQNRDIDSKGMLKAGFSELRSNKFHFDYGKFSVLSDSIKYWRLFVPDKLPKSHKMEEINPFALTSDIENFKATLIIDAEGNRSGKNDVPIFPNLNSRSNSYVYYDGKYYDGKKNPFVKDTLYTRDSFYFELKPFFFNSLDNYVKEMVTFKGKMVSAQIFPDFEELLKVREKDFSLGFVHKTPEKGYPVYKVKGRFAGEIDLSNRGLWGKGKIQYLGATLESEDVKFLPKQMLASAKDFDLAEKRSKEEEVPQVHGELVRLDWRPYRDSMYVRSEKNAFQIFKSGEHTLTGSLALTPGGLKGNGLLDWPQAAMTSKQFNFGAFSAKADTTALKIKAEEVGAIAIQSDRLRSDVDFDKQLGRFKSLDEYLETKLPLNQYVTSMNEFIWEMKNSMIRFKSDSTKLGTFTSVHPDQDSLRFRGKRASYDLKTYLLKVTEVPFIKSADAMIIPDSGTVYVQPKAIMDSLHNATIICDTLNKNHKINRATVALKGRKDYWARGYYEYNVANKEQEILFSDIVGQRVGKGKASEKATATRAQGTVAEEDSFIIDRKTSFFGTINLSSESVNLKFDGFARLEADKLPVRHWFTLKSVGDKSNLAIKYDSPKSMDGVPLETGFYLSKEMSFAYPSVIMPLYFRKDRPILPTKGVFKYDASKDQFIFGDSSKVMANDLRGSRLIFNNKNGKVEGEGKLNIGSALKYVSVDAAGSILGEFTNIPDSLIGKTPPPPVDIDVLAGLSMRIPEKLMRIMQNEVEAAGFGSETVNYLTDLPYYQRRLSMMLPADPDVDKAITELNSGLFELPKKFNPYSFLLSGLKMRWDMDYQSFVSTKDKIGLVSMNGQPVNKVITSYVEFKMPSNDDDRIYFYLKLPNDIYYYYGYKQGILEITSNDSRFMDEANKMKKTELVLKMEDGENFEIQMVDNNRAQAFVQRVKVAGKK
ncbi:MAG: hypothetical protein IPO07_24275 [Haliscomenobacter sp.]|nr:hypothetical protein [Haliscomenobacter sp.]MBK9491562.1 hypothetical protein [Haliscomenobacter sp.]